jgi:hypothetical protein
MDGNRQTRLNSPILCGFRNYLSIRRVADLFLEDFLFPFFIFIGICLKMAKPAILRVRSGKNRHF